MYWNQQEKVVFGLIFFLVSCIQIVIVYTFIKELHTEISGFFVIGVNLILFIGMLYYAKWVWKLKTVISAFKKVVIYEVIVVLFFILLIIKLRLDGIDV